MRGRKNGASLSSTNNWFLKYDLLCHRDETGDSTEYTLSELLGCSQMNDHQETYIAISEWLQKKVRVPPSTILNNHAINETKHNPVLWTSKCKRPDLHIVTTDMEHVLVQVEVESGRNKKSTIMKLTLGLMDQLCRLRNHVHTGIMKCSGFYFMSHSSEGDHVIHVELEWNDEFWKFIQILRRLSKDSVATEIKNALDAAKLSLGSAPLHQKPTNHALPISGSFIKCRFGEYAIQVQSGQSVVIVDEVFKSVYKRCFDSQEEARLLVLLNINPKPVNSAFPMSMNKQFFQYDLFGPPLDSQKARDNAIDFVKSVCEAINELHDDFNIAHLDLRLANICISTNTPLSVKLIDLDRSDKAIKPFCYSSLTFHASVMYKVATPEWKLSQLDWRQLGIMVHAFLNNIHDGYHSIEPDPKSPFLKRLVKQGEYDRERHAKWDPKDDTYYDWA